MTVLQVCIFLLPADLSYGQGNYIVQHYTNENGLPANGITGIELDRENGFLWVGTQAGLVRFDGRNFKNFSSGKKPGVVSRIHLITKNREGTIFCEDDNYSVFRITNNRVEFVLTDSIFIEYFFLKGGRIQTRSAKETAEFFRHHRRSSFLHNTIVFFDEPGDSSSFFFTYLGHACHYNAARDSLLYFPEDLNFQSILKLDTRVYFVRENLDLWEYNDSLKKLLPVSTEGMPAWSEQGEKPRYMWKPGVKEPLLVYKQDVWKLQRTGNSLRLQPVCRGCCPADVHIDEVQIWEEKSILFFGSAVNGLYVVKTPYLHAVRTDTVYKERGRAEYALAEMTPGVITTPYGLSFSSQGKILPGKTGMQFNRYSLYQSQQGDGWTYNRDTIIHFHRNNGHYTKMAVNDGAAKMVFAETKDRLYVISDRAIAEITGDRYRPLYELPFMANALKNLFDPDAAIEWKPGILAIASAKLVMFDTENGKAPDTIPIPGLTAKVRALFKYGDYLLIGTYGQGFYMYKNGIVKKMPLDNNAYLNYAHCFMPDSKGFCWISTNHGLFKAGLQALVAAYENNLSEIYYHYFGKDDGMYNTELNGGCQPCALQLSTGQFAFPSMNGVVMIDPLQPHAPPPAGQIFIEEIQANAVLYKPGDSLLDVLPHGLRNLRFGITLPQFSNLENIYFSYKLEPYIDDWETHDVVKYPSLQFGGLPPGNYTLYVRVRNGFEPGQFDISKVNFRILKPWYWSWWFYLLSLFGFIAIIWGLVKWRTATIAKRKEELQAQVAMQTKQLESHLQLLQDQQGKLEEDNKIKARLIGIISHDMISPVRFMGFLAKKLRNAFAADDPSYQTADAFVTVSQELESLSVNMLSWIQFHHDAYQMQRERFNLQHLVNESTEIASILAKEKNIQLYNDVPAETYITQYRQALGVIIYNLAMNAMKYTKSGEIRITGSFRDEGFTLVVTDTGIGIPPNMVNQLNSPEPVLTGYGTGAVKKFQFGYLIIKDLLQLVEGSMTVESLLNEGTTVTIFLKTV